jgi:hypothetical protein
MRFFLLIFFLAFVCLSTGQVLASSSVIHESYHLCKRHHECSRRFFLSEHEHSDGDGDSDEKKTFEYFFDRFCDEFSNPAHLSHLLKTSLANDSNVRHLWTLTMSRASWCSENEEWVHGTRRCRCRDGKVCHETPATHYTFDRIVVDIFLVVFGVILLYFSVRQMQALIDLRKTLQRAYNAQQR